MKKKQVKKLTRKVERKLDGMTPEQRAAYLEKAAAKLGKKDPGNPEQRRALKELTAGIMEFAEMIPTSMRMLALFEKTADGTATDADRAEFEHLMMTDQYRQWEKWVGQTETDEHGFGVLLSCRHPLPPPPPLPWPPGPWQWNVVCDVCGNDVVVEFVEPED